MMSIKNLRRNPKRFVKETKNNLLSNSGLLLYVLPLFAIPATIKAFASGNLLGIIVNAGGYAAYWVAARILRKGLQAELVYQEKRVTRPPKWPLKLVSAGIVSATTFVVAWLGAHYPFFVSVAFGLGALLGMFFTYGIDPRRVKTIAGTHGYTIEEISQTIGQAQQVILRIENANNKINNTEFNSRIDRICETARQIVDDLEANPGAIRRARKFLLVYLDGASKVASGYAETHLHSAPGELEQNFREVLVNLESVFTEQKDKLFEEDVFDLDVQMEVLAKQLKHEGII
jgi:5-bromo-4-chloroindolyl phosphate hydrolysis protein